MKKRMAAIAAVCILLLSCAVGCGKDQPQSAEPDIPLHEVMDSILAQVTMPEMMTLTAENLLDYYGLEEQDLADSAVCINMNGYEKEEIVLLRAADADRVQGIVDQLNASLQDAAAQMQNYLPEQYAMIQKSEVRQSGTYVWLFVSESNEQMQAILDTYLQ